MKLVHHRKLERRHRVPSYRREPSCRTGVRFRIEQLVLCKKFGLHRGQKMHRMMPVGHRREQIHHKELIHRNRFDLLMEQWQRIGAGVVWEMIGSFDLEVCKIAPQV